MTKETDNAIERLQQATALVWRKRLVASRRINVCVRSKCQQLQQRLLRCVPPVVTEKKSVEAFLRAVGHCIRH